MSSELIQYIVDRLERDLEGIREDFNRRHEVPTRFAVINDLFPDEIAVKISEAFPKVTDMDLLDSFRERKYTTRSLDKLEPLIADTIFAFQDQRVIDLISSITGCKDMVADPLLYAGGISSMTNGHFLNPHIDNSHDYEQKNYRVLNLLYYCSPDWDPEKGGSLELWDESVASAIEIPSLFNRLVIMETNERSWHSVNEISGDQARLCVSNYYFSPHSPNGHETEHITFFRARPEQKLRRVMTAADGHLRSALRRVVKKGIGKRDIYENK